MALKNLEAPLIKLIGKLPFWLTHWLGSSIGWLIARLNVKPRRIADTNIAMCQPSLSAKEQSKLRKASFKHFGMMLAESGYLWTRPKDKVLGLMQAVENDHLVEEALAQGKGLILATPHLGSWEMAALYSSNRWGITGIYQTFKNPAVETMLFDCRSRFGAELVPANKRGVLGVVKALKAGKVTGMLPDQDPRQGRGEAIFAPFYGVQANTATLLAKLAQRDKTPVLYAACERLPKAKGFKLTFSPADPAIYSDDLLEAVTSVNRDVERVIDTNPEQYWWAYARFKRRPEGEPKVYK